MNNAPILQKVWDAKDRLAAEAGYDIHRFGEQLREWSKAHPHTGPVVKNAEELRRYCEQLDEETLVLREEPPQRRE